MVLLAASHGVSASAHDEALLVAVFRPRQPNPVALTFSIRPNAVAALWKNTVTADFALYTGEFYCVQQAPACHAEGP